MATVALPRSARARPRPPAGLAELPPGPASPPAAQFLRWIVEPGRYLRASRERFGDVFTLRLTLGDIVIVSDPQLIKRIFTADPDVLRAGEANVFLEPVVGSGSLLVLDRDEHLRERRLLLPPFHGRRIERYAQLIAEEADRELERWPVGEPVRHPPAHAGDHAGGDPARRVRARRRRGARLDRDARRPVHGLGDQPRPADPAARALARRRAAAAGPRAARSRGI